MRGNAVHGNGNGPAQHAAEESAHPFRAVIAPQQDSVALADPPGLQLAGKTKCHLGDLPVCPPQRAKAATMHVRDFTFARQVQLRIFDQGLWHLSLKYRFSPQFAKRQSAAKSSFLQLAISK